MGLAPILVLCILPPSYDSVFLETGGSPVNEFGKPARMYSGYESRLETLRAIYGKNKTIPASYELAALIALSHYPELKEVEIDFVVENKRAPIASWPAIGSLLGRKKNRRYRVFISEDPKWGSSPALLKNMSFNAQIGALGHELAHTVHFEKKSGSTRLLAKQPLLGRIGRIYGTREWDVSGLPYIVPYLVRGDMVLILRVIQTAMDWDDLENQ